MKIILFVTPITTASTECTFLQDFLEIQKKHISISRNSWRNVCLVLNANIIILYGIVFLGGDWTGYSLHPVQSPPRNINPLETGNYYNKKLVICINTVLRKDLFEIF